MSKNNDVVSVVISTRKIDDEYLKHVEKMFSHPQTEILIYENDNEFSLTKIYNRGLNDAKNDVVVFMHDDLILETPNISPKIAKLFEKHPDYGIIGVAGTDKLVNGIWWQNRENMYGVVGHIHEGKRHVNKYSKGSYVDKLKEVVIVDGLFFMVHKKRIKKLFNEEFGDFHFYDICFCVENYMQGVKIGVTTKINLTHKSIGITNKKWEKNRLFFEALYSQFLPLEVTG
jgi:glycosyltransferase involved in cell wall biosynthesis